MTHAWWYAARGAGLLAWLLLSASVVLGLLLSSHVAGRRLATPKLRRLHRDISVAAVVLVAIHILTIVADSFVTFDLADVLVPFAANWKPVPVALGVIAMWGLVAVGVTTALRDRIGAATWRAVHLASYVSYAAATVHFVSAGSDVGAPLVKPAALVVTAGIAALSGVALGRRSGRDRRTAPTSGHERDRGSLPAGGGQVHGAGRGGPRGGVGAARAM